MNMRTIHACALVALVAVPASLAGVVAGCSSTAETGTDCLNNCAESNNCPGETMVDCTSQCADDVELNTAAGCDSEYNAQQSCIANLSDACTSTSACASQLMAWEQCVDAYCVTRPTSPECNTD
jgi:hypothetical protein